MNRTRRSRPLLSASVGVATLTITACGGATSGNLMAPPACPASQVHTADGFGDCADECPPGTAVLNPASEPGYDYCEPHDAGTAADTGLPAEDTGVE